MKLNIFISKGKACLTIIDLNVEPKSLFFNIKAFSFLELFEKKKVDVKKNIRGIIGATNKAIPKKRKTKPNNKYKYLKAIFFIFQ